MHDLEISWKEQNLSVSFFFRFSLNFAIEQSIPYFLLEHPVIGETFLENLSEFLKLIYNLFDVKNLDL